MCHLLLFYLGKPDIPRLFISARINETYDQEGVRTKRTDDRC